MANSFSAADLRKTLSFPFQSKGGWNHFLIGSALLFANAFIPFIPALLVNGYFVRLMRNAIHDQPFSLPDWDQWGDLAKDGFRSMVIAFIYLGPGFVVWFGGFLVYFVVAFLGAIMSESGSANRTMIQTFPLLFLIAIIILFGSMFFGWLLSVLGALPLPVALAHFVARDKFSAAFDLRVIGKLILADKWGYLLSWVVVIGLSGLVYIGFFLLYSTVILCAFAYLIVTPFVFYVMLVASVLFGSFYREGTLTSLEAPPS